jgi:hypothetical protein
MNPNSLSNEKKGRIGRSYEPEFAVERQERSHREVL